MLSDRVILKGQQINKKLLHPKLKVSVWKINKSREHKIKPRLKEWAD